MVLGIITDILIMILTGVSAMLSGNAFPAVMLGGLMMMAFTAGYVIEEKNALLAVLQFSVAVMFAVCSGAWWGFLVIACISGVRDGIKFVSAVSCYVLYGVIMLIAGFGSGDTRRDAAVLLVTLMLEAVVLLIILGLGRLEFRIREQRSTDRNRVIKAGINELHEKKRSMELVKQNYYAEKNARLIERENISRNIHNSVGHSITAAIMTLDAADMLYDKDPEAARAKMNDAGVRIRGSLESIRSAVRALDSESGDTDIKDMICYVDNIIDNFTMDTPIKVHKLYNIYSDGMKIPNEHAEFLTGVLQEFLTNGVKHGSATEFMVTLTGDSGHIKLSVKDNGKGGLTEDNKDALIASGFGIRKIISYVERCGGSSRFGSEDGDGFEAEVELPI